jgi:hypothetical protein
MAINFLNTVDLNYNQLNKAAIQNLGADPAVGVLGQLIFNTAGGILKVCTVASVGATSATWVEVGGGVETITTNDDPVSVGEAITVLNAVSGAVTIQAFKYNGAGNVGYVPEGGTSSTVLQGDGTWVTNVNTTYTIDVPTGTTSINLRGATPITNDAIALTGSGLISIARTSDSELTFSTSADNYASWTLAGDTGSSTVSSGETATIAGNSVAGKEGIDTVEAARTVNINLDLAEINTSATVAVADTVIFNRAADNKNIRARVDDIHVNQLGAPEANMLGGGFQYKDLADGTDATDAVNLQQLEAAVTGSLQFRGGFNAGTGALDAPLTGNLTTGATRVALELGDYYVVTTAGSFYGSVALDIGDSVICDTPAAAGASVLLDWTIVQGNEGVVDFTNNNPAGTFVAYGTVNTNARGSVTIGGVDLTASGTKDSTTFLRGDNTFDLPPIISVVQDTAISQLGIKVTTASNIATVGLDVVGLTSLAATPASDDILPIYDLSTTTNKKVTVANLAAAISGQTSKRLLLNVATTDVTQQTSPPAGTIGWVIAGAAVGATDALDMTMELVKVSDGTTSYASVTRSGADMTINFVNTPVVAQGDYTALVTKIG